MIVDLMQMQGNHDIYPLYFIHRCGGFFYRSYIRREDGYYIRMNSPKNWECMYTDGHTSKLTPDAFHNYKSMWEQVTAGDVIELLSNEQV